MLRRLQRRASASIRAWLLSSGLTGWALGAPPADPALPHGFVDPCSVAFIEDANLDCELCAPVPGNPAHCNDTLGAQGYEKKCQTGFHSRPGEVWCIDEAAVAARARTRYAAVLAVTLSTLVGAFVLFTRRRRRAKGSP